LNHQDLFICKKKKTIPDPDVAREQTPPFLQGGEVKQALISQFTP